MGAAAASTAAFYTGTAVMTALLIRKGVLRPGDLRNAPSASEVRCPVGLAATWQVPHAACVLSTGLLASGSQQLCISTRVHRFIGQLRTQHSSAVAGCGHAEAGHPLRLLHRLCCVLASDSHQPGYGCGARHMCFCGSGSAMGRSCQSHEADQRPRAFSNFDCVVMQTMSLASMVCRLQTPVMRWADRACCGRRAALGAVALAAHTIVKQIIDFAMAIFGTFSTVSQTLVASSLGKVSSVR